MNRAAWPVIVHGVPKTWTRLSEHTHTPNSNLRICFWQIMVLLDQQRLELISRCSPNLTDPHHSLCTSTFLGPLCPHKWPACSGPLSLQPQEPDQPLNFSEKATGTQAEQWLAQLDRIQSGLEPKIYGSESWPQMAHFPWSRCHLSSA